MPTPRILQPGEIESFTCAFPVLLPPDERLFQTRADRLHQIAPGHSLEHSLEFIATIAEHQQTLFDTLTDLPGPDAQHLEHCHAHGFPPLATQGWSRDPVWRELVRGLARDLAATVPPQGQVVLTQLGAQSDDWLEAQARALLALDLGRIDIAASAMIGAALQVYWSRLAHDLDSAPIARPENTALCPVCGSHPIVSLVQVGGSLDSLRYLVCSLCASQWHLERVKCSSCDNTRAIGYQTIENPQAPIRAESCPECHSYLKILYRNLLADLEPVADDLASLALDWLMSEEGYARSGVNLMMIQGDDGS